VMIRLSRVEHRLLQAILREDGLHMQTFFRLAAKKKIQQHAQALAAVEGDDGEDRSC
jgi:hypothetical protein